MTPEQERLIRERDQRPCVWDEGAVPRHVAEFLWDAVHDRHALLAALDATRAERDEARKIPQEEDIRSIITDWLGPQRLSLYTAEHIYRMVQGVVIFAAAHRSRA